MGFANLIQDLQVDHRGGQECPCSTCCLSEAVLRGVRMKRKLLVVEAMAVEAFHRGCYFRCLLSHSQAPRLVRRSSVTGRWTWTSHQRGIQNHHLKGLMNCVEKKTMRGVEKIDEGSGIRLTQMAGCGCRHPEPEDQRMGEKGEKVGDFTYLG